MKIRNILPFFALSIIVLTVSCNESEKYKVTKDENGKLIAQKISEIKEIGEVEETLPTIIEFTSVDKGFSTLSEAIKTAELTETFTQDGGFTIFAPINMAFDKLPPKSAEKLLKPENKERLATILKYHIIPSVISKEDIVKAVQEGGGSIPLKTLEGSRITASLKGGTVYLIDKSGNGGRLITTNVEASNGFIHTVDAIMMPKE
ncbi:fasciclin domain-containing protein [Aquimarina algiphila]|uniref:Fasciclin domain-containing protein n=1 Tax=Aquimarina algiphila TaxID=2047982 RepID=A0A554VR29_9FLAO|nr:fasciclin domain-containing protein [Aquimarina algiphila]TSE11069.1 fasciclin domain-containing protein [Aquimarina algiphila]